MKNRLVTILLIGAVFTFVVAVIVGAAIDGGGFHWFAEGVINTSAVISSP